ncbi:sodium/pantothenate symporter domain protein [Orientia tsutsugamushi str. UT76]|nr:sodium/pantothenate symporter domain protein [Orientia tsutsugamushi str. UT76]
MFTILGFRTTTRVVVSGMIAGISTTFIWNKYFNAALPIGDLMPATIANFVVMMIMHYCLGEPGGWVGPSDRRPLNVLKEKRKQQINSISSFFKSLSHGLSWIIFVLIAIMKHFVVGTIILSTPLLQLHH